MANNSVVTQEAFLDFYADNIRPYLNGATHTGFTPVGTVISYFGETAPEHFLICDGTEYAKSDYPQLADLLLNLTDPTPFEGSDANHFKVPDLRGEFLRGTGTNSHTNQGSGANVGTHQDSTEIPRINTYSGNEVYIYKDKTSSTESNQMKNTDTNVEIQSNASRIRLSGSDSTMTTESYIRNTSRPTNTSVLYCIAYKNIYIDSSVGGFPVDVTNPQDKQGLTFDATNNKWVNGAGGMHEYSTDEHVVGTWIDGKPIYEKSGVILNPSTSSRNNIGLSNVEMIININTVACTIRSTGYVYYYLPFANSSSVLISTSFGGDLASLNLSVNTSGFSETINALYYTVQYTKTTD